MKLGRITEIDFNEGMGYITEMIYWKDYADEDGVISSRYNEYSNKKRNLTNYPFNFIEYKSDYPPCRLRIVVFDYDDDGIASNIYDFTITKYPELIERINSKQFVLICNPQMLDYYIQYYKNEKISILYNLLNNSSYFNKDYHLNGFEIYIDASGTNRPGNDDLASISIRAKINYDPNIDPYLQSILPPYYEVVNKDRGNYSWEILLNGLWSELGGKELGMSILNKKCVEKQSELIERFNLSYDEYEHFKLLEIEYKKELLKIKRDIFNALKPRNA